MSKYDKYKKDKEQEVLGFKEVTEGDMICKDCMWRAELYNMAPAFCELFPNGKLLEVLCRGQDGKCYGYEKDE